MRLHILVGELVGESSRHRNPPRSSPPRAAKNGILVPRRVRLGPYSTKNCPSYFSISTYDRRFPFSSPPKVMITISGLCGALTASFLHKFSVMDFSRTNSETNTVPEKRLSE